MGQIERRYVHEYDDPYKVLVSALVPQLSVPELQRLLHDRTYIKTLLRAEVRQVDMNGPLLDCLSVALVEAGKRLEYKRELEKLVEYFDKNIDVDRLRHEVAVFLEENDIDIL